MDTRIVKRLLRRLLPAPAHNALRRAVYARWLNRVPAMTVNLATLPKAADFAFPELSGQGDIAAGCAKAGQAVAQVLPDAPGSHSISHENRRAIYGLIRHWQPRSVLEIGTNRGALTCHIALAMQEYRPRDGPPRLVTVDLFDVNNPDTAGAKRYGIATPPRNLLARLHCAGTVEFAVARSTNYLAGHAGQFDCIIMDTAAAADIAYQDIALATRALRPGGLLLVHPYSPGGKSPPAGGYVGTSGFYIAVCRLRREGAGLVPLPCPTPGGQSDLVVLARE